MKTAASLFEIDERVVARPLRWVAPVVEIDHHHRLRGGAAEEAVRQLKSDLAMSQAPVQSFLAAGSGGSRPHSPTTSSSVTRCWHGKGSSRLDRSRRHIWVRRSAVGLRPAVRRAWGPRHGLRDACHGPATVARGARRWRCALGGPGEVGEGLLDTPAGGCSGGQGEHPRSLARGRRMPARRRGRSLDARYAWRN